MVRVLAAAEPTDKAELYSQLGILLHYDPSGSVAVEARPRVATVRVGGPAARVMEDLAAHRRLAGSSPRVCL